jgi:XTP/dITP diphosphohydrolase
MKLLTYATSNDYKLLAANTALRKFGVTLRKMPNDAPDILEIQSDSQEAVAIDKAQKYFELLKEPLIVMDFGFFIEGLQGFPGVYTKHAIHTIGVDGLIALARQISDRRAFTQRTIVYIDGQTVKTFSSRCNGTILLDKRGNNGRDYDFIFCVDKTAKTLAEMTEEEKSEASGEAWRQFGKWFKGMKAQEAV